jgi:hypothetical protein
LIAYDLGNYAEAQKRLGQLLSDRKLGTPMIETVENGETQVVENDKYWEATLKLLKSNVALAGDGQTDARTASENYLKQLYIRWGDQVGGKKWGPDFQKLRKELIPNFDPNAEPDTTPAPASTPTAPEAQPEATTQPASAG